MIVLDASVMIAILDSSDIHFESAREIFRDRVSERMVAHRLTVAETLVQAARVDRAKAVAGLLAELGVEYLDEVDDPVALAELRSSSGLRMPDCCVLLTAVSARATLATFDQRLAQTARAVGVQVIGT